MTDHDPETTAEPAAAEPDAGEKPPAEEDTPPAPDDAAQGRTAASSDVATHADEQPIANKPECGGVHPPSGPVTKGAVQCGGHMKCCGSRCPQPALRGARVCVMHGASASQVQAAARRRLMEATDPVAARLVEIALKAGAKDADAVRAAEAVLDRAGIPRRQELQVDSDQVRADIEQRLAELETPEPDPDGDLDESPAEDDDVPPATDPADDTPTENR